ncbi:hypothetical protein OAA_10265 [Vibrio cyclitrophicus 1F175]|uniref:GNAT family N-acetyltransferase n=3 Tax=Vibrio cyclitrophicus TaxID=47951 RepID=UPI000306EE91|nr:GNAT family N-acetyltransferase [Vibrio cyclitrophicus]OEF64767.1 hypothetical protein OAA_10265 [Vibrio cyclitrophicus 1F175]
MEIKVVEAKEQYFDKLLCFYKTHYESSNRIFKNDYLKWLLLDNPNGSGQCVTVTLNDEIIGNFFLVATSVTVNGVVKKGYFATDVLTHPEHRDKNLFVKMIRKSITYLKEEKKFIVGHPNKNAIPGWKRTKMEFGPEMSSFISKPKKPFSNIKIKELNTKKALFDLRCEVSDLINNSNDSIVNADVDYIYWRFLKHPNQKYIINAIYRNECFCGLLVSMKYKGFVDRVIHYIADDKQISSVINSSLKPKIFYVPQSMAQSSYQNLLFKINLGSNINFFITNYDSDGKIDGKRISFAACDI